MQGHETRGQARGHQACRDEHRDTALTECTGTPGSWGHQAHRDARLKESHPQMLSGFSEPLKRQAGGDKPVTSRWHKRPGSVWGCTLPAPGVRVPCERPLSQAVSPDPLNHWKIRQGWQTGDVTNPE